MFREITVIADLCSTKAMAEQALVFLKSQFEILRVTEPYVKQESHAGEFGWSICFSNSANWDLYMKDFAVMNIAARHFVAGYHAGHNAGISARSRPNN